MRRKLAAGNWKMNGSNAALAEIAALAAHPAQSEVLICPPATLIAAAVRAASGAVMIGAQDCHASASGAHTGDIAAPMLAEAGATHVIVGHSERRSDHGETSAQVAAKAAAARTAGLTPIICVGETAAERAAGRAEEIVTRQMLESLPADSDATLIVAYEPIWAIGTGDTATTDDIAMMHRALRAALSEHLGVEAAHKIRLLYGGSVKPGNAREIFAVADVDGALVGGASLTASDFGTIIAALDQA